MTRVFSGIQPTGEVHLGNLLGALRNWVRDQHTADFHILRRRPPRPHRAAGPGRAVHAGSWHSCCSPSGSIRRWPGSSRASSVDEHTGLAWTAWSAMAAVGEPRRTQFKDKSDGAALQPGGLFTYPALMAADICCTTPITSRSATTSASTSS
ncbi:MAG: hypothetical protein R2699_15605 [Acidimicrobiales bacterium]